MDKSKLIIVEGIPGSGKTTTAETIWEIVREQGAKPLLYLENAHYHPVDLDNLSYLDDYHYHKLLEQFSSYQSHIHAMAEKAKDGYFVHYLKWYDLYPFKYPPELLEGLMKYDAHDTLAPDKYRALLMGRWEKFAADTVKRDEIVILECCLFQNPLTVFLGKHNYPPEVVKSYIYEIAEYVTELYPLLVYLHGESVRSTLERVIQTRPQKWIDLVVSYITGQGYGKAHNLQGLPGVFSFYELLQEHMYEIASQLEWKKLIVNNSNWRWEQYTQEIGAFVKQNIQDK
jgi:hypothetical protein